MKLSKIRTLILVSSLFKCGVSTLQFLAFHFAYIILATFKLQYTW